MEMFRTSQCQDGVELISIRFNLLQFCPSVASVVSVMLFLPSFKGLNGYFYVSLNLMGIL